MKISQLKAETLIDAGQPFIEATYVGGSVETVNAQVKGASKGVKEARVVVKHLLNRGAKAYVVNEWLPAGTKAADVTITFKPGDMILIELWAYSRDGVGMDCMGQMSLVEFTDKLPAKAVDMSAGKLSKKDLVLGATP